MYGNCIEEIFVMLKTKINILCRCIRDSRVVQRTKALHLSV
jgi:hypothetical protein